MANPGARRHNAEVLERRLTPFQEDVPLHVALILAVHVHLEGARVAEFVDHHRVVDHQIDRVQRVDLFRVAAKADDAVAHRGKVHHRRNAGEVLHQHAGRAIGDLARVFAAEFRPVGKGADVVKADGFAILEPQHVFQHHLQRGGQLGEITQARGLCRRDRVIGDGRAACGQGLAGLCAVLSDDHGHQGLLASGVMVNSGVLLPDHRGFRKGVGLFVCNCMQKIQPRI
ncbi:hypothetical protein GALL_518380 [mine drainage metagenome]|uniref:Uncharacterized protein n=1 Tax=mine drainage metagenome TaxID=410659 RepID=A0A1J5PFJ0_9ZZZZ